MLRRFSDWWNLRVLGKAVTRAGPIPGSTVTRYRSPLSDGEVIHTSDEMSMGAQGHAYFQGPLTTMQAWETLAVATNRRVVLFGEEGKSSLSLAWDDISGYWVGEIAFPSVPPKTGRAVVLFLDSPTQDLPFPEADLVVDPFDVDEWLRALRSHGKQPRT